MGNARNMKKEVFATIFLLVDVLCQVQLDDQYKSVLDYPRIHFSGTFVVNAATVNNIYNNYNTDEFLDHHGLPNDEGGKGGWNPYGSNDFLLQDVTIHTVCYTDGSCIKDKYRDNAIGKKVNGKYIGFQTAAKVVDLDPEAQQYTQIWGLEINIPGLLQGKADALTMQRHWQNILSMNTKNDYSHSGTTHGVLSDIIWDINLEGSEIIKQLKSEMQRLGSKDLSIRLVLDTFLVKKMVGRVYGTIGLQGIKSSTTSILERLLVPENKTVYQDAPFKIVKELDKVVLEIGSCFPTDKHGKLLTKDKYVIAYAEKVTNRSTDISCSSRFTFLAKVPLDREKWLEDEAGFLTIQLSKSQVMLLENRSLVVLKVRGQMPNLTCMEIIMQECADGIVVRPTGKFLFRKDSGESVSVRLAAKKFGKPYANLEIGLFLTQNSSKFYCCWPEFPLPDGFTTDRDGIVTVNITLPVLRNPRKFIDGQVYGIAYYPKNTCLGKKIYSTKVATDYVIPVKVYSYHEYPDKVTWAEHVYPVFQQYANLYPIMKRPSVDLSSYHSVVNMKDIISLSMNLPMSHPNYMPVTRDLSKRKRRMISKWLAAEKPRIGDINKMITVQHLRKLLQSAVEVEHATIPPYMTALWSIRDGFNTQVHRLIKTVIRQEMLHMGLVANLLNAVGGSPSFIHSSFIPKYPTPLPGGLQPNLIVSLEKLSPHVIRDVFMKIEKPDTSESDRIFRQAIFSHVKVFVLRDFCSNGSTDSQCRHFLKTHPNNVYNVTRGCPTIVKDFIDSSSKDGENKQGHMHGVNFKSGIAAFYTHVLYVIAKLTNCGVDNSIFTGDPGRQLTTDSYHYGNGKLFKVTDYVTAIKAVMTIIEEGEGTSDCDPAVHYLKEQDDLSHYTMFHTILQQRRINIKKKIKKGVEGYYNATWEECDIHEKPYEFSGKRVQYVPSATWPIKKNAKETDYKPGSLPRVMSKVFARLYNRLLGSLHKAFNGEKEFFVNAKFLMYAVDYYGRRIVRMPIDKKNSPFSGPNAAPIFKWVKEEVKNLRTLKQTTDHYASFNTAKKLQQKELARNNAKVRKNGGKSTGRKSVNKPNKRIIKANKRIIKPNKRIIKPNKLMKPKHKRKRCRNKCKENKNRKFHRYIARYNPYRHTTEERHRHKRPESINLQPDFEDRQRGYIHRKSEFERLKESMNYDDYIRKLFDESEEESDGNAPHREEFEEQLVDYLDDEPRNEGPGKEDPRDQEPRDEERRADKRFEDENDELDRQQSSTRSYFSDRQRTSENGQRYENF